MQALQSVNGTTCRVDCHLLLDLLVKQSVNSDGSLWLPRNDI